MSISINELEDIIFIAPAAGNTYLLGKSNWHQKTIIMHFDSTGKVLRSVIFPVKYTKFIMLTSTKILGYDPISNHFRILSIEDYSSQKGYLWDIMPPKSELHVELFT